MANEENLISFDKRTENELREMTKNGGKASGESRRKKKAEKDYIAMLMGLPINNNDVKNKLADMGVADEMHTNELRVAFKLFQLAADGDLAAIKYIDERTGNSPQLKLKREELNIKKRELKLKEKEMAEAEEMCIEDLKPLAEMINKK